RSALRFGTASLASIDSGYRSLIALLTSLDPSTMMQIANAIFYRNDFPFNQSFLNDASTYFDAGQGAGLHGRPGNSLGSQRLGQHQDARPHSQGPRLRRSVDGDVLA